MISPFAEFTPIRVDIRIIVKDGSAEESEVPPGTIAPPSSPRQEEGTCRSLKRDKRCRIKPELQNLQFSVSKDSNEYNPRCKTKSAWKSPELERDSSASSDASKTSSFSNNNFIQHNTKLPTCGFKRHQPLKTRREGIVISPFSERYVNKNDNEFCATCKSSSLKSAGNGFFRGKPALTPFTRLGCYKMQTSKSKFILMPTATSEEGRCHTTEIPRSAPIRPQRVQRPSSQIPLKSYGRNYVDLHRLTYSRSNRPMAMHRYSSSDNKRDKISVCPVNKTDHDIHTNAKSANVESSSDKSVLSPIATKAPDKDFSDIERRPSPYAKTIPPLQHKNYSNLQKHRDGANLPAKKGKTAFAAPFVEREIMYKTAKTSLRKMVRRPSKVERDLNLDLNKDNLIFYRKHVVKTQLSPFRRTMKINETTTGLLPPSTNPSVYILQ